MAIAEYVIFFFLLDFSFGCFLLIVLIWVCNSKSFGLIFLILISWLTGYLLFVSVDDSNLDTYMGITFLKDKNSTVKFGTGGEYKGDSVVVQGAKFYHRKRPHTFHQGLLCQVGRYIWRKILVPIISFGWSQHRPPTNFMQLRHSEHKFFTLILRRKQTHN